MAAAEEAGHGSRSARSRCSAAADPRGVPSSWARYGAGDVLALGWRDALACALGTVAGRAVTRRCHTGTVPTIDPTIRAYLGARDATAAARSAVCAQVRGRVCAQRPACRTRGRAGQILTSSTSCWPTIGGPTWASRSALGAGRRSSSSTRPETGRRERDGMGSWHAGLGYHIILPSAHKFADCDFACEIVSQRVCSRPHHPPNKNRFRRSFREGYSYVALGFAFASHLAGRRPWDALTLARARGRLFASGRAASWL